MEQVILSVNYVGVQSAAPLERGGTGPWEALETALAQLCSRAFPSLALWPQDGFAGRGAGAEEEGEGPCAGCCGWWLTLQLSLRLPLSTLTSQAGTALTRG